MAEPSAAPPTSASGMPLLGGARLLGATAMPLPGAAAPLAAPTLAGADPEGLLAMVRTRIPGALGDVEPVAGPRPLSMPAAGFDGPAFSYARKRNGSPLPAPPEVDGRPLRPLTPEQAARNRRIIVVVAAVFVSVCIGVSVWGPSPWAAMCSLPRGAMTP